METKTTSQEIEFDITKALIIIENDADLNDMFRSKYATEYDMCHALINSGSGLKPQAEKYIKGIFEKVILVSSTLREAYINLDKKAKRIETVKPIDVVETPIVEVVGEEKTNNKKRWGLRSIEEDVTNNFGGKSKQIHKTASKIQELKKIFSRLEMRSYNERFVKQTLTDDELRELGGAIETFEKKINSILKPKNKK